ncbi:MAG: 2-C-methyl-D-erythritol 4-phosphate cytidylyltransferase [Bacteroidetes bacterium]|nr:MAG: 2-C-methyl-D-erythritol 4-phosphate cytidylyltransferase [Bacteroidota bacterium]
MSLVRISKAFFYLFGKYNILKTDYMNKNIAIILAGGSGLRLESKLPKQFIEVAGKTLIEYTINTFQKANSIDEIAIVINTDYFSEIKTIITNNNFSKVKKILAGGKDRNGSSLSAINAYKTEENHDNINLIFHDAVRPLVSNNIIENVVNALKEYNSVDVAVPATDTIMEIDKNGFIKKIPNRKYLKISQTPQAFKLSTIKKAYEIALQDPNFMTTDDCSVVLKYLKDEKIFIVNGSEENIKITYKSDLLLFEELLKQQ